MENLLTQWDYNQSVERVKTNYFKWKNLTVEMVAELFRARSELDSRGNNQYNRNVANATFQKTWTDYVSDCGLDRSTVHRWLERYIPEENKLLTTQELEEKKQIEHRRTVDKQQAIQIRVNERIKTGKIPADWNDETEKAYNAELKRRQDIETARAKTQERLSAEIREKERRAAEYQAQREKDNLLTDALRDATDELIKKETEKKQWKEKIKLSQDGNSDKFIDALMEYLQELPDNNRRIEACQNIIKVCRNLSAEYQRV